ncbi:MAG: ATP-binding cassette domain-containing protein [Thermoleophilia bacterium]|nr:ATP-binding cassette domain-containing protein [Thermoleophilia bacterium]
MTPAVQAKDLFYLYRAAYGDVAALRGLSLEVHEGEVVSVLGPSGSGKSTLLGLCSGSLRPSSGELVVLGRSIERMRGPELAGLRRSSIGIVRQHYHRTLPRELSVEEIVALPLRLLGRYGREERLRVAHIVRAAGLGRRAAARPDELSGGEQQRVAVSAALAKRPPLLLADEPTGELDARNSEAVVELMLELASEANTAALIVTHDPEVALRTERTIHIRDGRLAAEGTTRPVLIVDEQGWLRLPRRLREEAGVRERVRAQASWGKVELLVEDLKERGREPSPVVAAPRIGAAEKRYETEVVLDRVTKHYGAQERAIVAELSWAFGAEQLHVLAGPSGSGKTTLLNIMAVLDRPDRGEVWVGGERVDSLGPNEAARWRQRVLGYVSQHSTLVEFLSARENVQLGLALRGFGEPEAAGRAERWLEWVGLGKLMHRRADRLSGGEQRRVALARALAPGPRVLLADEPTAHLDRLAGRIVIKLLQQAAREQGATIIAASHDPDMVAAADGRLSLGSHEERSARAPSSLPRHARRQLRTEEESGSN